MKRRILAMSMAAVTALTSTSICAFADGQNSEALASAITIAKTRLEIPEELTEFSYNTSENYKTTTYNLTWSTPADADALESGHFRHVPGNYTYRVFLHFRSFRQSKTVTFPQ